MESPQSIPTNSIRVPLFLMQSFSFSISLMLHSLHTPQKFRMTHFPRKSERRTFCPSISKNSKSGAGNFFLPSYEISCPILVFLLYIQLAANRSYSLQWPYLLHEQNKTHVRTVNVVFNANADFFFIFPSFLMRQDADKNFIITPYARLALSDQLNQPVLYF